VPGALGILSAAGIPSAKRCAAVANLFLDLPIIPALDTAILPATPKRSVDRQLQLLVLFSSIAD